jgi:hypothetical protein
VFVDAEPPSIGKLPTQRLKEKRQRTLRQRVGADAGVCGKLQNLAFSSTKTSSKLRDGDFGFPGAANL